MGQSSIVEREKRERRGTKEERSGTAGGVWVFFTFYELETKHPSSGPLLEKHGA